MFDVSETGAEKVHILLSDKTVQLQTQRQMQSKHLWMMVRNHPNTLSVCPSHCVIVKAVTTVSIQIP